MDTKFKKFISSTVDFHEFRNAVEIARELGYGIEISRFGKLRELDSHFDSTLKEYKAVLADFDNEISCHGFFSNLSIASKDPLIREISYKRYQQSFEIACELGAKTVVFHTCLNNLLKHKDYQASFFVNNIEFYKEFAKQFEREGIVATIENVHEAAPDWIRTLISAVNSPNLKATLDVGHTNLHSPLAPSDWVRDWGILLHHMHIHNNFGDEDAHGALSNGGVDYPTLFKTINEIELRPSITFEIFNKDALFESVRSFEEVLENASFLSDFVACRSARQALIAPALAPTYVFK